MLTLSAQLECELSERDNRIAELRHALTMLDKDHDSLRADADTKDETIAQLRKQLEKQVSLISLILLPIISKFSRHSSVD